MHNNITENSGYMLGIESLVLSYFYHSGQEREKRIAKNNNTPANITHDNTLKYDHSYLVTD